MNNNNIKLVSDYLKRIGDNLKAKEEKQKQLDALNEEIDTLKNSHTNLELVPYYAKLGKLQNEIEDLKEPSKEIVAEYNAISKLYEEKYNRIKELRSKLSTNTNDILYGNSKYNNIYKVSSEEEKINFEISKPFYQEELEMLENSLVKYVDALQKIENTMFESEKKNTEPQTNVSVSQKEVATSSVNQKEVATSSVNQKEEQAKEQSQLTLEEARQLVNAKDQNWLKDEDEIVEHKIFVEECMKKTGLEKEELMKLAQKIVNENEDVINSEGKNQNSIGTVEMGKILSLTDISELENLENSKETEQSIRKILGLADDVEITNSHLAQAQEKIQKSSKRKKSDGRIKPKSRKNDGETHLVTKIRDYLLEHPVPVIASGILAVAVAAKMLFTGGFGVGPAISALTGGFLTTTGAVGLKLKKGVKKK